MSYEVAIVSDSISPAGARITTFQLKYPRIIHAEMLTHRMFSRNASSTRAIPTAKMIEWIEKDPAMPVYWGKNRPGMAATEEFKADEIPECEAVWLNARNDAIFHAKYLMDKGVHKQIASRILEPFAHINVVLTATSFDNFFALRCHLAAMPEIQVLAVKMAKLYRDGDPVYGGPILRRPLLDWHLPYISHEVHDYSIDDCLKMSVARCARVSYLTFDGKPPDPKTDIKLHDQLRDSAHWSPFEHQAQCLDNAAWSSGNFRGWHQYRGALDIAREPFDFATLDQFGERDFIV